MNRFTTLSIKILTCLILVLMFSCQLRSGGENPMFRKNLNGQKERIKEDLDRFQSEGIIDEKVHNIIYNRLIADCDSCINWPQRMTCEEIDDMAKKAIVEFDSIKMSEELFSNISLTYHTIASANQSRSGNFLDIGAYCNPERILGEWFKARQTTEDRFNEIRNRIKRFERSSLDKISKEKVKEVAQRAYEDVAKVQQDSTLSKDSIQQLIKASLDASIAPKMEMMYTRDIGNIYSRLAVIRAIDDSDITAYLMSEDNNPEMKRPETYEELREYVEMRIEAMYERDLINRTDRNTMKRIMLNDLDTFLKGSQAEEQLIARAKESLKKLEKLELDTEDREFIAETYYDMGQRKEINLADMVNEYLYGKEMMELTKQIEKEKANQ